MATLPVYPGATPTTDFNPGFGPPSFPLEQPIYLSRSPGDVRQLLLPVGDN
jgi:hypothetical protein